MTAVAPPALARLSPERFETPAILKKLAVASRQLAELKGVSSSRREGIATINAIKLALLDYKHRIRAHHRFYSQDLINNLFSHPYTKIQFVEEKLGVSRLTATKYLNTLTEGGFLQKHRVGRSNFYVNTALFGILTGPPMQPPTGP